MTIARWLFASNRRLFQISPDEPSTLAMARWLAGGTRWDMFDNTTWRPGLATLMAPLMWVVDDQTMQYRLGLALGAAMGGLAAVVLSQLVLRLTTLSLRSALLASGAVALSAASLSASAHLWAEPLVTLTFLLTLLMLMRFFDQPRLGIGVAAVGWAVAGYTCHGRLLPLAIVAGLATAGKLALDRRWRDSVILLFVAASTTAASGWYASLFVEALWIDPNDRNTVGALLRRLTDPGDIAAATVGQVWYLLVSTFGLFGIGFVEMTRRALARSGNVERSDARVVMAATLPLFGLSILFMSGRDRVDHLIYGRYNDAVIWPILIVGLSWLVARSAISWRSFDRHSVWVLGGVMSVMLETGLLVYVLHRDRLAGSTGIVEMTAGLLPLLPDLYGTPVLFMSCVSVGVLLVVMGVLRQNRTQGLWIALTACGLVFGGLRAHRLLGDNLNFAQESTAVSDVSLEILPPGSRVVFGLVPEQFGPGVPAATQNYYAHLYQWYLPETDFRVTSVGDYPENGWVFAPIRDPILVDGGAAIVWQDPAVDIGLWRTTTSP